MVIFSSYLVAILKVHVGVAHNQLHSDSRVDVKDVGGHNIGWLASGSFKKVDFKDIEHEVYSKVGFEGFDLFLKVKTVITKLIL